jgi:hypothetical protein
VAHAPLTDEYREKVTATAQRAGQDEHEQEGI